MVAGLLDGGREELEALFDELAEELLALGVFVDVLMVGGSWLLWFGERVTTRDVDSARRLPGEVRGAVARVADSHDLDPEWLNDRASAFLPQDFDPTTCTTVFEHEALVVQTPPPETIFLMKLYRASAPDREDLIKLWPQCNFTGPDEVVARFFDAYPHAPDDPYLVDYVEAITADAEPPDQ